MENIQQARVYVGTYAKYNNGSLFGKWLDLSDYSDIDEFYEACKVLHSDEDDPEYMFQDHENIPFGLISESSISESIFEIIEAVSEMDDQRQEAFLTWCNYLSKDMANDNISELIDSFDDEYQGQYDNEEDFAYYIVEEFYELTDFMKSYFDYEKFARDLFICDYWIDNGYVFRNC